jgi:hypothetical protein
MYGLGNRMRAMMGCFIIGTLYSTITTTTLLYCCSYLQRMRAVVGCFMIALAAKRVMFVDWKHLYTFWEPAQMKEHRDMPGMCCIANEYYASSY